MKLKRTVTIEIDRVKITTTHCAKNVFRCDLCGAETEFLSRSEAVGLAKIMQRHGLKIIQANLHFYQRDERQMLVCLNSIIMGNNFVVINKLIS